jgi:hypothetical protein
MPTTAVYSAAAMTATICYIAEDPRDDSLAGLTSWSGQPERKSSRSSTAGASIPCKFKTSGQGAGAVNRFLRLIPAIGACVVVGACASNHPTSTAGAASRPVVPPAAPPDGTAATSARANRIVLEDKTLTNDEIKALFAQGYKPTGRDGKVYYCRQEMKTGSRFATMTCKTAEQMKQLTQDSKDLANTSQKTGGCRANAAGC